ncbi:MAG: epoxyqueuosine reductase QueH [Candidatus Omnitrophica bacterium]|nr:epoxyqueuosine reductase QueH [Candidatus Omnitrophota bacterium]
MKLLLHACCAPCAIYPVREAKKENLSVTGFFYNPNIHPPSEYFKRKRETETYFKSEGLELVSGDYDVRTFFDNVREGKIAPARCAACWGMRLEKTASFADQNGFDMFTTTLLGSPYQDHEIIKGICEDLSEKTNQNFYYKDLRAGFKAAHKEAKEKGIYCQNYCGCVFSIVEREEAKAR